MKVLYSLDEVKVLDKTGVALGNFDGVHIGHQKLINNAVQSCKSKGLSSIIFTFVNHPKNITKQSDAVKRIITWKEKMRFIESLGVDYLVAVEFDNIFKKMDPHDFIKDILVSKLNMKEAHCGFHYRFGYKASGNTELLEELSTQYDYELYVLDPVLIEGTLVSSTKIRELIATGQMAACAKFLGRRYAVEGDVVYGKQNGKKMGFPTANLLVNENRVIPPNGVYITKCFVENKIYNSITNIGFNPTFGGDRRLIETFIFDFNKDIYGENIKVEFYKQLRGEIKFDNIEELKEQIMSDVNTAKAYYKIK